MINATEFSDYSIKEEDVEIKIKLKKQAAFTDRINGELKEYTILGTDRRYTLERCHYPKETGNEMLRIRCAIYNGTYDKVFDKYKGACLHQ